MTRAVALALLPLAALTGGNAAGEGVTVSVTVTEMRNAKGLVRACMTSEPKGFPRCNAANTYTASVNAHQGTLSFAFKGVKPGRYAIALLHDENSNGKADRVLGLLPKEGIGFSRDAKIRMGPPSFADAAVDVGAEDRKLTIRMRYLT